MTKILRIESDVDPDWNGTWNKADIEQEMKELDNIPEDDNEWISWTLDHVFAFNDGMNADIEKVICSDAFVNGTFLINNQLVTIFKS